MTLFLPLKPFKYIISALLWPFILCLTTFFALIFIFQFMNKADYFFQDAESFQYMYQYFSLLSISYLPIILPFCLLFSVLFGYGRLSQNLELTALSNMGYTKGQLAQPALCFMLGCFLICSNAVHTWGPKAKLISRGLHDMLLEKAALSAFQPGVFLSQFPGMVLYAEEEKGGTSELQKVFLVQDNKTSGANVIFSKTGHFIKKSEENFVGLHLDNGSIYGKNTNQDNTKIDYKSYVIKLFKNTVFSVNAKRPDRITSKNLLRQKTPAFRLEFHKRLVLSISCIVFCVLALLFSLKLHNRSSKGNGFFVALMISVFFWISLFTSEYFSLKHSLYILMYAPILVFLIIIYAVYAWNTSKSII